MNKPAWVAVLLALAVTPAGARECGEGRIGGGMSVTSDALQIADCALTARIYCRLAEDRDVGLEQDEARRHTVDWVQRLHGTGTHHRGNWDPVVAIAAADVFRQQGRRPGTIYYRAAYACALAKRTPDPAAAASAGRAFDQEADRCEQAHPTPRARSFPNTPLRDCLSRAVERLTSPAP